VSPGRSSRALLAALALLALPSCATSAESAPTSRRSADLAASVIASAKALAPDASVAPTSSAASDRSKDRITIAFVGDISTSLLVQNYLDGEATPEPPVDADYPFHFVADRLKGYDLMVGNLECVVTETGTRTRKFPLRGSTKTPGLLVDAGFDVMNVANNHQNDLGPVAYDDALDRLRKAGLAISGDQVENHDPILVREVGPVKLAIVGIYNKKIREAVQLVKEAKKRAPIVVAFMHWGDDYHSKITGSQKILGHAIIDAGAECIVGAHAHVVQPEETYAGKLISYGLGNFVFTGMAARGTHNGALIELDFEPSGLVDHRYRKVDVDKQGIPRFVGGDATAQPFVDPPLDAPQNEPVPIPAKI
jgi:hypothetical protein